MTGTYSRSGSYEYLDFASHAQYSNSSDTDYSRTAFNYGNSTNENFSSEVTLYPNNGQSLSKGIHEYIGRRNTPALAAIPSRCRWYHRDKARAKSFGPEPQVHWPPDNCLH